MEEFIKRYFPPEQWSNAFKVAQGESSLDPNAVNFNTNGTRDIGLFQINEIHAPAIKKEFGYDYEELKDPAKNAQVAAWIYQRNRGWGPWVEAQKLGIRGFTPANPDTTPITAPSPTPTPTYPLRPSQDYNLQLQGIKSPLPGKDYNVTREPSLIDKIFGAGNGKPSLLQNILFPKAEAAYTPSFSPSYSDQYTVKPGDTLWDIATKYLGSGTHWQDLGYKGNPRALQVGTRLNIPRQVSTPPPNTSTNRGPVYTSPPQPKPNLITPTFKSYIPPQQQQQSRYSSRPPVQNYPTIKFDFTPATAYGGSATLR